MATNNPPSMRFPFEAQIAKLPAEVQHVHRTAWNAITDLQQAIPQLKGQIDTINKSVTSLTSSTGSSRGSAFVTENEVASQISASVSSAILTLKALFPGDVNNQIGATSYTTVQNDYGALIVFKDSSSIAASLAVTSSLPGITLPWYCGILNEGAGTVTVTPLSGQINGAASVPVGTGELAFIYYDGTNFWAGITAASGSGVTQIIAGTGISISPSGGTGNVTVSLTTPVSVADGGTGTTTPALVAGSGISITGSWPDQTIAATGSSYLKGTVTIPSSGHSSGTFIGTGTVTGAAIGSGQTVLASVDGLIQTFGAAGQFIIAADVSGTNQVEVQATLPNISPATYNNITFNVAVFP